MRKNPQVTFSTPVALRRSLAGWWTRGGAITIDLMITAAIELALLLIVWTAKGSPRLTLAHEETLLFEVGLPVAILYAPILLARRGERNGQTVGKQALGIRVVREDGLPLTLATAFVREALGRQFLVFLTSGLYLPIDYLWPLWDARNQALHDKIGRTFVVAADGSAPVLPGHAADPCARGWAEHHERNLAGSSDTVRGDWLPPVAPSPDEAE